MQRALKKLTNSAIWHIFNSNHNFCRFMQYFVVCTEPWMLKENTKPNTTLISSKCNVIKWAKNRQKQKEIDERSFVMNHELDVSIQRIIDSYLQCLMSSQYAFYSSDGSGLSEPENLTRAWSIFPNPKNLKILKPESDKTQKLKKNSKPEGKNYWKCTFCGTFLAQNQLNPKTQPEPDDFSQTR